MATEQTKSPAVTFTCGCVVTFTEHGKRLTNKLTPCAEHAGPKQSITRFAIVSAALREMRRTIPITTC